MASAIDALITAWHKLKAFDNVEHSAELGVVLLVLSAVVIFKVLHIIEPCVSRRKLL
jgi:hypothetical protein